MKLIDNTVLITGGSSGIGFEMAKEFLKRKNKVIITGRNEHKLQQAKELLGDVVTIQNDVSNPEDVEHLFRQVSSEFPELNILINNAGVMWTIDLQQHNYNKTDLTKEFDINVKGTIWMNDTFLPLLKNNANAAVVTVSSGLAFVPLPIAPIYSATKAALHSYTLSLREQLRNTDVQVFELAPPATQTGLLDTFKASDMKGTAIMPVENMVAAFFEGLAKDQHEICPGQAKQLKFMSRFFPNFILKQMSKSVASMHAEQ